jgi:S1-C subfamily serine protease
MSERYVPDTAGFESATLSGNIGSMVLSRFTLTFDYAHHTIYFEPNANFGLPFTGPRTFGFTCAFNGNGAVVVNHVDPASAAATAGLHRGDTIISLNDIQAAVVLKSPGSIERLADENAPLQIDFSEGGVEHEIAVPASDLLHPTATPTP